MEVTRYQPKYLTALQALYLESRQDTFHWADADAFKLSDFELDTEGEEIWVAVSGNKVLGFASIGNLKASSITSMFARECYVLGLVLLYSILANNITLI